MVFCCLVWLQLNLSQGQMRHKGRLSGWSHTWYSTAKKYKLARVWRWDCDLSSAVRDTRSSSFSVTDTIESNSSASGRRKKNSPHRPTRKTLFERALEGVSISLEVAAAAVTTVMQLTGHQGWGIAAHRDTEEPAGLHLDTTRGNKSAQHNVDHKSVAILVCIQATVRSGGGHREGGCSCLSCLSRQMCNTCWNKCRGCDWLHSC